MRHSVSLLALLCWTPAIAGAQQAKLPAQVQPQVWPPAQGAAQPQGTTAPQSTPVPAQVPAAPQQAAPAPEAASGQIQLNVVVTGKAGEPISGLNRSDFTLLDNNHPVDIESFHAYGGSQAASETPQQIILVIDSVNIGFQEVSYSRYGIDQFLRNDGGRLAQPVSIYWYTDNGGLEDGEGPTTDGNALAAQLDTNEGKLRTLNRSAGAWGAIERFEMSVRVIENIAEQAARQPGRKLLIWIGPGWPILDNPNMQMSWKDEQGLFRNIVELSTLIRQAQMQIYSVTPGMPNNFTYLYQSYIKGVKKPSQVALPDLDLKVLAVQSGGQAMSPSNDLASEIGKCARDASAYYTISFTPAHADEPNQYHELKLHVDKPGLTARTNTGYYSDPDWKTQPRR